MTGFTGIPRRVLSPIAFDDMVELYNQLPWRVFSVSDGECFGMKSCWFAGVKCDMKTEGVNIEGGGCWARGARGQRSRRCGGGDLIGGGLWYSYECFSLENCYFTVLWRDFSGGTGYLGRMMGTRTVQGYQKYTQH
jgi:hypothetical protein